MTTKRLPLPPKHLKADGRALWRSVHRDFVLEDWQLRVLVAACDAMDRMVQAREVLDAEGLTVDHEKHGLRPHPCVSIERDARTAMLRALRELGLDTTAVEPAARPRMLQGGRRYGRAG